MVFKRELEKRVDKKKAELDAVTAHITELKAKAAAIEAVISELQSLLKTLPKEESETNETPERELRRGSDVYNAREVLRKAKKPLYIDSILAAMNKDVAPETRRSLGGQLAWYVRQDSIFTRTEPNTFGLKEFGNFSEQENDMDDLFSHVKDTENLSVQ